MRASPIWVLMGVLWLSNAALAQDNDPVGDDTESAADADKEKPDDAVEGDKPAPVAETAAPTTPPRWWFGAYLQGAFVPAFMLDLFLGEAPTVGGAGFGVTATHRDADGFSVTLGLGYQSYAFNGPFRIKGDPEQDTEYLHSTLGLLHLRGEMTWSTEIVPKTLSFEYGIGLDLGVILGQMKRSEAYRDSPGSGSFHPCRGALQPANVSSSGGPYCELPQTPGASTDAYNQHGAQYNVVEKRVPPVALTPMLPVLALRYTPVRQVALKLDAAFGLLQFVVGISASYGVDL